MQGEGARVREFFFKLSNNQHIKKKKVGHIIQRIIDNVAVYQCVPIYCRAIAYGPRYVLIRCE